LTNEESETRVQNIMEKLHMRIESNIVILEESETDFSIIVNKYILA